MTGERTGIGSRQWLSRYHLVFAALIAFLLPFQTFGPGAGLNLVPILIGVWGIAWLADLAFAFRSMRWRPVPAMVWQSLFVLVTLLGLLWSSNQEAGMVRVQVRMSMLALPLMLAGKEIRPSDERTILRSFLAGTTITALFCLARALFRFAGGDPYALWYTEFSYFLHPSYFALFLVITGASVIIRDDVLPRSWQRLGLLAFNILILFFLSSRAGLLSGAFVLLVSALLFPARGIRSARWPVAAMVLLLFLAAWLGNYRSSPSALHEETTQTAEGSITVPESAYSHSNSLRLMVWQSALDRLQGHWLWGYGSGDAQDQLNEEYSEREYAVPVQKKLNAHNQYLEVLLETGIPGLAMLLGMLLAVGWRAWRRANHLLLVILLAFALNFLFESMLNTQAGTISFALFLTILPVRHYKSKTSQA